MDDLDATAARFEEDVTRIHAFANGDEEETFTTVDGREIPSLSRIVANVEEMIRPDLEAIDAAVGASQGAASSAGQSAGAAAGSANTAQDDALNAQNAAVSTQADAIAASDDAARAEAAANAAGTARDAAVGAQSSVAQNVELANGAANRAAASEEVARDIAGQVTRDRDAVEELATEAAGHAMTSEQNATDAGQSATDAGQNATAAAESATAAADSAREAGQSIPGLVLLSTQGPTGVANVFRDLAGFDMYELVVTGLIATDDLAELGMHFSWDNGETWVTTNQYNTVTAFTSGAGMAVNPVNAANHIGIWGNISGIPVGTPYGQINGVIRFFNFEAAEAGRLPSCSFDMAGLGGLGTLTKLDGAGVLVALSGQPVNAFRIFAGGHGFQRGTLSLYGRRR
jgi:hypothetical protein